jgi:alkanesulfonate monooxygenase SsuD/methylene tetrahydromethanopterin reductase-like flavin-dependent oxidoreductase (luciferase family)
MRTGMFFLFESLGKKPVAQVYRDAEEEAIFGEEIGFTGVHPAEHHFSDDYGIMPRVELFLAKIAGRTRRIRLTPMVTVAPLTDAVRMAEDACLLDNLSEGRFTLSVGSGYRAYEFEAFGLKIEENRERIREALEVVQKAFSEDRFSYEGKHYRYKDVHVVPRPRQQPHMPIWLTTSSTSQVEWAAKQGFGVLPAAGWSYPMIKSDRDLYTKAARDAGRDPTKLDAPAFKWIYVGETDAQAREVARTAFMETFAAFFVGGERLVQLLLQRIKLPGVDMSTASDPEKFFELLTSDDFPVCIYGSPDTVRSKLSPLRSCGVDYFIGGFSIGALPSEEIRKSMRRYAERVMPHI